MEFRPTQAARDCQSCKRWCETNSKADSTSAAKEAQEPKWSFRPDPAKHKGRKLRPGEAGLSWRRTDAGADALAPVPARKGTTAKHHWSARARPARVQREAPFPIRAKAQLSLGSHNSSPARKRPAAITRSDAIRLMKMPMP